MKGYVRAAFHTIWISIIVYFVTMVFIPGPSHTLPLVICGIITLVFAGLSSTFGWFFTESEEWGKPLYGPMLVSSQTFFTLALVQLFNESASLPWDRPAYVLSNVAFIGILILFICNFMLLARVVINLTNTSESESPHYIKRSDLGPLIGDMCWQAFIQTIVLIIIWFLAHSKVTFVG